MNKLAAILGILLLASCTVVHRQSSDPDPQPAPQPARNDPPPPSNPPPPPGPSPWPPGISALPPGTPWYHDKLEMKYDAALEDCYTASRKALGFMKFTEADMAKKSGEIVAHAGTISVRCTMYRKSHHTFLTFYFRVHGQRADARMPGDFAKRCHDFVGKEVKEEGRRTD